MSKKKSKDNSLDKLQDKSKDKSENKSDNKLENKSKDISMNKSEDISKDKSQLSDADIIVQEESSGNIIQTSKEEIHKESDKDINRGDINKGLSEQAVDTEELSNKNNKKLLIKVLRIGFTLGFVIFAVLFIRELLTQYKLGKSINETQSYAKELYNSELPSVTPIIEATVDETNDNNYSEENIHNFGPTPDPNRDNRGRLLKFRSLLEANEDVKGWISVPNTNVDYPVLQRAGDPKYYYNRDFVGNEVKAGSIYIDYKSSVEPETKTRNVVLTGHNMKSLNSMFHQLTKYKDIEFYKENPIFTFDTIYETGQYKIFAIFITNGSSEKEELFNYTVTSFRNDSDFLNFIYQLRIRSLYNIDTVDVNENDQLLILSTCTYEVNNYRMAIVARKIREDEPNIVDVDTVTENKSPLYPKTYYKRYGGKAPKLAETFEEALENEEIKWYRPNGEDYIPNEPVPTEAPKPTKKPEPTKAPKPTKKPEPTKAPEPTKKPEPTKAPEPTEIPEPTDEPVPTSKAEPIEELDNSAGVTENPVAAGIPSPTPTSIPAE